MSKVVVVCDHEGGYFRPYEGKSAPIRIYSDGRIEDDIAAKHTGDFREKISKEQLRSIIDAAIENKRNGYKGRLDIG